MCVVGDEQVRPAVSVVVEHRHAERFAAGVSGARLLARVFELASAEVVEQPRGGALVRFRGAVGFRYTVERAPQVILLAPLDVVGDEQVQLAVAVVIEPGGAGSHLRVLNASEFRYVAEFAAAFVVVEPVPFQRGEVDIFAAIIVVVGNRHAHPIGFDIESAACGHVFERAVLVVAVESG